MANLLFSPQDPTAALPKRQRARSHALYRFGIIFSLSLASLGLGAVAARNSMLFSRKSTSLHKLWAKDQARGLTWTQLSPLTSTLARIKNSWAGPIPAPWLGSWFWGAKMSALSGNSRTLLEVATQKSKARALAAGARLVETNHGRPGLSLTTIKNEVAKTQNLKALAHLTASWTALAQKQQNTWAKLEAISHGLLQGQPKDVLQAESSLKNKLAQASTNWRGVSAAQDGLADVRHYLTLSPSEQITQHGGLVSELTQDLSHLRPASANPFGRTFAQYLATRQS